MVSAWPRYKKFFGAKSESEICSRFKANLLFTIEKINKTSRFLKQNKKFAALRMANIKSVKKPKQKWCDSCHKVDFVCMYVVCISMYINKYVFMYGCTYVCIRKSLFSIRLN